MPKSLCLRIARTLGCIRLDKQLDLLLSAFQIDLAVCFVFPVVFPDHRKAEQIHIKMSGALIIASDDRNVVNFFGQSARFDCQLSGTLFQYVCCRRCLLCTVCQGRNDFFKNSIQLVLGLIGSRRQDHKQILIRQHIAVLSKKGVRGAVLWGILGGAALYYVLGLTVPGFYGDLSSTLKIDFVGPFRDFGEMAFGKVFTEGFDFSAYVSAHGTADLVVVFITTSLAFCMVDMFDTLGTLYGACARGNMLLPNGEVPNMDKAMLADAIATTTGAICGTSTVTTFVESSAGVAEGGRTGLAAMATAALFFIAMFLSPIASLIPTAATAAALIYVGVLMINCVKDLDWMDPSVALPSFLTMAMMPFTYNISYGIAFGLISYVLIRIFTGKIREVKVGTWVITILFLLMLFLTH